MSAAEPTTYYRIAASRLEQLWHALYGRDCPPEVWSRLDAMLLPWGHTEVPRRALWPSDIGDDYSPYEFSVAFGAGVDPSVRLLVESQGIEPTLASMREAALDLTRRFEPLGADVSRFDKVSSLFLPPVPHARFALWHAAQLSGELEAKAYFNPQIAGVQQAYALVEAAMRRLGFASTWPAVLRATQHQGKGDEIRYFALDLARGPTARVKLYFYQHGADASHFEHMAAQSPGYVPGELSDFCYAMTGTYGPYTRFPLCAYLSFTEGHLEPTDITLQIPMRHYVGNDAVARNRICKYMHSRGLDAEQYVTALRALAPRSLQLRSGLNTYVSLRAGARRLTVYIASELFRAATCLSEPHPRLIERIL